MITAKAANIRLCVISICNIPYEKVDDSSSNASDADQDVTPIRRKTRSKALDVRLSIANRV